MTPVDDFWKDRRVALTGATGFVGHHTALALAWRGARVCAVVRSRERATRLLAAGIDCRVGDLDDLPSLERGMAGADVVFHLAGAVDFGDDWIRLRRVNVEGTRNVLRVAKRCGVRRVVHTSSVVAVGASDDATLLDESSPWTIGPLRVPYATSKREAEVAALDESGVEVVVVNPSCVVGPDDHSHSEFGTLCRRFWKGRIPFNFSGGNNFVDVRDVALGHLLAAERGEAGERYILGGENRTFTAFFGDLARFARRTIPRLWLPACLAPHLAALDQRFRRTGKPAMTPTQAPLATRYLFVSSGKARRKLGYEPRPLLDSLRDAHTFWTRREAKAA